jgi:Sec-independent protein translocase protein TatA
MGDFGKGIKSFKKGLAEEGDSQPPELPQQQAKPSQDKRASPAPAETGNASSGN